jgi:hypothetical protein
MRKNIVIAGGCCSGLYVPLFWILAYLQASIVAVRLVSSTFFISEYELDLWS